MALEIKDEISVYYLNEKTKRIEFELFSLLEYSHIKNILIPELKKQDLGQREIFYKMKSLEAGIRHKLMQLAAYESLQPKRESKKRKKK